jgi:release factor glutamine methyltransferase
MHANVKEHEPALALFVSDEDPLKYYRAIAAFAMRNLLKNGMVAVEINEALAIETGEVFRSAGFSNIRLVKDLNGKDRILLMKREYDAGR